MKLSRLVMLVTALVSCSVTAATVVGKPSLNQSMTRIGTVMVELLPLTMATRELTQAEKFKVGNSLHQLSGLFESVEPQIDRKSDAYQISYEYVTTYLKDVSRAYDKDDIDYVRSRLYSLGSICTSCHTQDTQLRTLFSGTGRDKFESDFAFAEFNYYTRNYAEAEKYYDRHLSSEVSKNELQLVNPLQRLVTIYTQVKGDPAQAAKQLKKYVSLKDHTPETLRYLQDSIEGLETLREQVSDIKSLSFDDVEQFASKYLGSYFAMAPVINSTPQEEVARVWLRGTLYHYLNAKATRDEVPYILYWLSVTDRSIGYNYYFSLADFYLKACITRYPEHPFAQRCYSEYEEYVRYFYITPLEPVLPKEVADELKALRKVIINKP